VNGVREGDRDKEKYPRLKAERNSCAFSTIVWREREKRQRGRETGEKRKREGYVWGEGSSGGEREERDWHSSEERKHVGEDNYGCVCLCMCVREREKEGGRARERERERPEP